jgi:hypothetical protein
MAARRLLIVLVLLLAASIGAALLAPDRRSTSVLPGESSSTTTTSTTSTTAEPTGEAVSARIDASPKNPETIEAAVGDQLALSVGVAKGPGRTINIKEFGVTDFAAPEAPAHFNLLLRDAGEFAITDENDEVVGRIVVAGPGDTPERNPGGGGGRDT